MEHRSSNTTSGQGRGIGVVRKFLKENWHNFLKESFKEKKLKTWESKIRKHFRGTTNCEEQLYSFKYRVISAQLYQESD